jgi:hypothetical protein
VAEKILDEGITNYLLILLMTYPPPLLQNQWLSLFPVTYHGHAV